MSEAVQYRKRRAAKACLSCRTRKVRCDYSTQGSPCSNCRQDRFECVAIERKKRKKSVNLLRQASEAVNPSQRSPSIPTRSSDTAHDASRNVHDGSADQGEDLSASPEDLQGHQSAKASSSSRHRMMHFVPHYPFLMGLSQAQRPDATSLEDVVLHLASDKKQGAVPPTSVCGPQELQYLQGMGCFDLPPPHITAGLIDAYFTIFHPFFPVVDKPKFLESVRDIENLGAVVANLANQPRSAQTSPNSSFSLLLLQAVIFIGSGVAPSEIISAAGFSSRKQARHTYYTKARRLYDLDHEQDPIITIQALLLISQYYPSITERKHTWHWIHQAISLAQASGLHRDPGKVPHRALWARIWWACVVRDRCSGLGTGRPLMINSLDCSISMLVLDDVVEEGDTELDLEVKAIFIEFAKLCQIFEGIVTLRYTSASTSDVEPPTQLKVCEDALEHWIQSLPPPAKRQDHLQTSVSGRIETGKLYRAILHAGYNTIRIALYQSHTLWNGSDDLNSACQAKLEFAALDNTQLFSHLVNLDLVKYCPTIAVTFTLAPLIVHVLGIRSAPSEERLQVHRNRFDLCMIFLRQLRDIYWHAIFYCEFFELAASINESRLVTHMSEAQDPLASFLTQRIWVGDLMVLQHYQNLGKTRGVGNEGLLSSRASPASGSYQQHWAPAFGRQSLETETPSHEVPNSGPSNPHHPPPMNRNLGYAESMETMNMNEWLAANGHPGNSGPFG